MERHQLSDITFSLTLPILNIVLEINHTPYIMSTHVPAHGILVLITFMEKLLNAHADVFSGARGLNFGLSLQLQ